MTSTFQSVSSSDLDIFFGLLIGSDDNTLFSTHQELIGASLSIELKHRPSHNTITGIHVFGQQKGVNRSFGELSGVPPENSTISGGSDQFGTCLHGQPGEMSDWVGMGLLDWGDHGRLTGMSLHVPDGHEPIVTASSDHV